MTVFITYITDQRPGEPDLIAGSEHATLEIRSLEGELLQSVAAPRMGWTHASLSAVQPQEAEEGADAYLGGSWIGSTEV
ncbi:hypothetical protein JMT66_23265 (plasmid) [Kosakonia cowanii]|uniref:hypothetical protein n=1 Tax=Kosakonia cowanii TaxID=208223 RepID=UPI001E3A926F|nr:hypothetical protein [Kosakonia cowanii]UGS48600.1 hypothetical protein JMT66_23265 [Kosakonia cowanii]